ncbi:MAG: FMN-binding protein [Pseudomonadales bacterium]
MSHSSRQALLTITVLTLGCAAVLWATERGTAPHIEAQRAAALRNSLTDLAGSARLQDLDQIPNWPVQLCDQMTLVQAQPRGYGGTITLAVALVPGAQGPEINNLQTVRHQETPGIGDFIAQRGADAWLQRFRKASELSLRNRTFAVDAVSGATVTVQAIRKGLQDLLTEVATDEDLFGTTPCIAPPVTLEPAA